ncbi:MAG: ABC transporter permease [Armatimonadota bacterium]|nr:ABC transporter permease [Armatimonadota bacterium]
MISPGSTSASAGLRRRRRARRAAGWLLLPAFVFLMVAFVVPVATVLATSVTEPPGGLSHYARFVGSPDLVRIFVRTVGMAAVATAIALVVGYPLTYFVTSGQGRPGKMVMAVVAGSLFVSLIVRSYAWLAILGRGGLVGWVGSRLGGDTSDLALAPTKLASLVGILQYAIPMMMLALYDVVRRVDRTLMHAAESLGAGPVRRFLRVYWPQTVPGVTAGSALVFVSVLGYYIIPSILGGPQNMMLGELIAVKMQTTLEYGLASALSSGLLVVGTVSYLLVRRASGGGR